MSRHETAEQRPKKKSRAGTVFLVLLLLLAGAVGYLYYSIVKAPLELDDPAAMAASFVVTIPPSISSTLSGIRFLKTSYCPWNSGINVGNCGR